MNGIVYVCPTKDSVCGDRPGNWCSVCPLHAPPPHFHTPTQYRVGCLCFICREKRSLKVRYRFWRSTSAFAPVWVRAQMMVSDDAEYPPQLIPTPERHVGMMPEFAADYVPAPQPDDIYRDAVQRVFDRRE